MSGRLGAMECSVRRLSIAAPAVLVAVLLAAAWSVSRGSTAVSATPTGDWRLQAPSAPSAIEGYASEVSVAPGETFHLHVSTSPAAHYVVEIYRIGWYGGSGGRLVGCFPTSCSPHSAGSALPVPPGDPATGELRADWPVTDEVAVPPDWQSGYYLAKLVLASGPDTGRSAGVPFIVRAAAGSTSRVLVVAPVNTWQAYNTWGGLSMYSDPKAAVRVSFDRPYAASDNKPFLDYPIARFLDQFGYDVAYTTDADVDADPAELTRHRVVVFPAHSEYWTKAMRDGLEAARGLGVNLAFLGGNTGYWQIRYRDPARRLLEEYRSATLDPLDNPRQKTVRWRDDPVLRPECALVSVQWQGGDESSDPGPHAYRVVTASLRDPWFAGTGFKQGDAVRGAVGYEWDAVAPECDSKLPQLTVLFHYAGRQTPQPAGVYTSSFHSTNADAVRYEAKSGATVFAAGSIDFGWAVTGSADGSPVGPGVVDPDHPPDPRLQRFMRNAFDALTASRG